MPGVSRSPIALLAAALLGCGPGGAGDTVRAPTTGPVATRVPVELAAARGEAGGPARRPLPGFEGFSLSGEKISVASLLGTRLVIFFFNPELARAATAARAVTAISGLRARHNFRILGVATGSSPRAAREFRERLGLDFPVLDDSNARVARKLALRQPLVMLGIDAEGYVGFAVSGEAEGPEAQAVLETQLREHLRLPVESAGPAPILGERPRAPRFTAVRLDAGEPPFVLAEELGRPLVLVFFLHTCPHCHAALRSLRSELERIPEASRPRLAGVSLSNRSYSVRERLRDEGLDFFPVLLDSDSSVRNAYGVLGGVPDTFLIDSQGFVTARVKGWRDGRDPPLMRMRLARLAGLEIPLVLDSRGYSGNEFCEVCHQVETATWEFTDHALAFDSLVKHGADADAECVRCHVVGFRESGGYDMAEPAPHLEGVGCETCHGRGGPHLSPDFVKERQYAPTCPACHDAEHSLGFEFQKFLPRISHVANRELASLPLEEKRKRLAERGRWRDDLLPTQAAFVGSEACKSCHEAEFRTWAASPHARAGASLVERGEAGNAQCLQCHTTGYGRQGGFPAGAALAERADRGRVGCESCHGPGADHVAEGAPRIGSIVALGDKCDSCVILQICGSCHDEANDPGFEFAVQSKIDRQRHGTTEAGTGRPLAGQEAACTICEMESEHALRYPREMIVLTSLTEDAKQGIRAFFEQREPTWRGR